MRDSLSARLRCKGLVRSGMVCIAAAGTFSSATTWAAPVPRACYRELIEGEVRAGQSFQAPIGGGLGVRLEAVEGGWIVQVLPGGAAPVIPDYAELATPPYRSVNPLHITTEFGFRAQDAVGWNPRRFRYAAGAAMYRRMAATFRAADGAGAGAAGAYAELARMVSGAPEASIEILDARLVPGTADQSPAAALVATHLNTTAHQMERPVGGAGTALGKLVWIRFRLRLDVADRPVPRSGVHIEPAPCTSPPG